MITLKRAFVLLSCLPDGDLFGKFDANTLLTRTLPFSLPLANNQIRTILSDAFSNRRPTGKLPLYERL